MSGKESLHSGARDVRPVGGAQAEFSQASVLENAEILPGNELVRFKFASDAVRERLRTEAQPPLSLGAGGLLEGLSKSLDCWEDLQKFTAALNAIGPQNPSRTQDVGRVILPFAIRNWSTSAPGGNADLILALYKRHHTHPQDREKIKIEFPDWLKVVSNLLVVQATAKDAPSHDAYLLESKELKSNLTAIQSRLAESRHKFSELQKKEDAVVSRTGKSMYGDGLTALQEEVKSIADEIPELFETLHDVAVDTFAPAMNSISLKVALHPKVINNFLEFGKSVEALLRAVLTINPNKAGAKASLSLPFLAVGKGVGVQNDVVNLVGADFVTIAKNPETLSELIAAYRRVRALAREVIPMCTGFSDLSASKDSAVAVLQRPFSRFKEEGERGWNALVSHKEEPVVAATLKLLADENYAPKGESAAPSIECSSNLVPVVWLARNSITSGLNESEDRFFAELARSQSIATSICEPLRAAKSALRGKRFQDLAQILSAEFDRVGISGGRLQVDLYRAITPLIVLDAVLQDSDAQVRLKNQIPDIERVKNLSARLGGTYQALNPYLTNLALDATRKVTPSLADYGQDQDLSELWEFVETFKVLIDHPEILHGVSGNEGMRSGLLLIGEFGVGKTHFVDCLCTELGIQKFVISPNEGEVSAQKIMIDACKKVVEKAKEYAKKSCCALVLDEAEELMSDRSDPKISLERAELTTYLLQAINDIRKNYPRILPIAMTNYAGRIDRGMYRDGRFDIKILMKKPGPAMREGLIRSTLAREKLVVELSDQEMQQLVQLTEGFIPLVIVRAIISENRLERIKRERDGGSVTFDFDSLKELFERERKYAEKAEQVLRESTSALK